MHTELLTKIIETPLATPRKRELLKHGPMRLDYNSTVEVDPEHAADRRHATVDHLEKYVADVTWRTVVYSHPDRHEARREALKVLHPMIANFIYGEIRTDVYEAIRLLYLAGMTPTDKAMCALTRIIEKTQV